MKRVHLTICVLVLLSVAGTATANGWQIIYQTDFSSDPGWITNAPKDCYWNSADGTYHFKMTHTQNQYTYHEVPYTNGASYKLGFDIKLTQCTWAGYVQMVFGRDDMRGMLRNEGPHWSVSYHYVDQGRTASLVYRNDSGGYYHPGQAQPARYELGVWYHNEVIYDASAGTLSLKVTNRQDGAIIGTQNFTNVGTFSNLSRLYMSVLGETYSPGATAEGYIANVILRVPAVGPVIPPIADAGDDIIADANEEVTLDGSGSSDTDGQIIKYTWKRLPDGVIIYSGSDPTCQTRALGRVEEVIELTVTDNSQATATDTLKIISRTTQQLKDQLAAMQSQIEQLQQQNQQQQDLIDRICAWPPIKQWLRRAIRLGDLNNDGAVNMSDFALLAKDWLH